MLGSLQLTKIQLLVTAFSMFYMPLSVAGDVQEETNHLLDVWLNYQKDAQNIPAIMAAVVKDDQVFWRKAVGAANLSPNIQASADTLTNICSNSKIISAVAIMTLVEQNKLELSSDIRKLIPEYSFFHPFNDQGPVTVKSLLSHTSGLPRDTGHGYWSAPDFHFPNKEEFKQNLSKLSTTTAVGNSVAYSNVGYALIGAIIEKVSGLSYKAYVEKHVFAPLNMNASVVEMQRGTHGTKHAIGYSAEDRYRNRVPVGFFTTKAMQSATGISTTINDWSKFAIWQLQEQSPTSKLMSSKLKQQMIKPQTQANNGWSRGLGYQIHNDDQGQTWAMHGGMCPGYNSYMKFNIDKKLGFAVFTNANRVTTAAYVKGLNNILALSEQHHDTAQSSSALKEYQGFYDPFPWNSQYYIAPWRGGLIVMYLPSGSLDHALEVYKPTTKDVFAKVVDKQFTNEELKFVRNSAGQVTHVINGGNSHPKKSEY